MTGMKRKLFWGSVAVAAAVVLSVGLLVATHFRETMAWLRSTRSFTPLKTDPRVSFEPGAEAIAQRVAECLTEAIHRVETEHHRPFSQPVRVFVCPTEDRYAHFTASGGRGVVFCGRLFLNAEKLARWPESIRPILTHELSHLHFNLQLGTVAYLRNIPGWFREGLAVCVSGGGGSDISEAEATEDLLAGEHFIPVLDGDVFFPLQLKHFRTTPRFDANPRRRDKSSRMWSLYRQASMFVAFIRRQDPEKFKTFLWALQDGRTFKDAWGKYYHTDINTVWSRFQTSLRGPLSRPATRPSPPK